jgi:hypothetical protein
MFHLEAVLVLLMELVALLQLLEEETEVLTVQVEMLLLTDLVAVEGEEILLLEAMDMLV